MTDFLKTPIYVVGAAETPLGEVWNHSELSMVAVAASLLDSNPEWALKVCHAWIGRVKEHEFLIVSDGPDPFAAGKPINLQQVLTCIRRLAPEPFVGAN